MKAKSITATEHLDCPICGCMIKKGESCYENDVDDIITCSVECTAEYKDQKKEKLYTRLCGKDCNCNTVVLFFDASISDCNLYAIENRIKVRTCYYGARLPDGVEVSTMFHKKIEV